MKSFQQQQNDFPLIDKENHNTVTLRQTYFVTWYLFPASSQFMFVVHPIFFVSKSNSIHNETQQSLF